MIIQLRFKILNEQSFFDAEFLDVVAMSLYFGGVKVKHMLWIIFQSVGRHLFHY